MLNTTSMFITFHGRLEDSIKDFYDNLASNARYGGARDVFLALARENGKHKEMMLRAYREVITDAFEGGFPLKSLDEEDYKLRTEMSEGMEFSNVLKRAVKVEEVSRKYCVDAAGSTKGLMANVPEAFEWVAKRKTRRLARLKKTLERD